MGKIQTVEIQRFDGGIASDPRSKDFSSCAMMKHFDCLTSPNRLLPWGGVEADTTGQSEIGHIIIGSTGVLFGLGGDPGNPGNQEIYTKSSGADPNSDWDDIANTLSGKAVNYKLFVEYKDYLYTADANRYIMRFDRTGVASVDTTYSDLTSFTNIAQGVIHPKDDILYIPYDNKIWSLNGHGGTPTLAALTLPSTRKIVGIAPYGNFLAIATVPTTGGTVSQASIVYLWDRDTSLTTVSESLNFGGGYIGAFGNLNDTLIAVMTSGTNSIYNRNRNSLVIKGYNGGSPFLIKEIYCAQASINPRVATTSGDKFYYSAVISQDNGGTQTSTDVGVWSVYKNSRGAWATTIDRLITSDNSDYTFGVLSAAISNSYCSAVGPTVGTLTITVASETDFTVASEYHSLIFGALNLGGSHTKKLLSVSVFYEPLPTAGSVTVKYRKDENISATGSYTTIFTDSTDNSISHTAVNIESSGATLPQGKEFQFLIQSTGGAIITGLRATFEDIEKDVYA